jgi:ribonuclease-3
MVRASVVNSAALAELATELDVGAGLMHGTGEDQSGGREKPSILADATEALIGAVYLDRGWAAAAAMVMRLLGDRIEVAAAGPGGQDYKTRLQELCARQFDQLPIYSLRDEGPDHAKAFEAVVHVHGRPQGFGRGRSKKQAEQAAAREAWERLKTTVDGGTGPRAVGGPVSQRGTSRRPPPEPGPGSGSEPGMGPGSGG